jgi:uncharacterized ferritin-like protein (DUF455 family)
VLDPRLFAGGPARDRRFRVAEVWAEAENFAPGDSRFTVEFLHRQMNEEVNGLEIAARALADFPDADWELRLAIARQCWDEARHVEMFRRLYERRGGRLGAYPVLNFQYRILTRIDSLVGRLAVQNRSFEAGGIDAIQAEIEAARVLGETEVVELLDAQLADEIQHVRYANEWIRRLVERGGPPATFELVRAIGQARAAFEVISGGTTVTYEVADGLRREAGFSDGEIEAAHHLTSGGSRKTPPMPPLGGAGEAGARSGTPQPRGQESAWLSNPCRGTGPEARSRVT